MKIKMLAVSFILAATMFLPAFGYAEVIQGEIANLNLEQNALSVNTMDASTGQTQQVDISGVMNANLKGLKSLTELKTGDTVIVSAAQNSESGVWEASAIEVSGDAAQAV